MVIDIDKIENLKIDLLKLVIEQLKLRIVGEKLQNKLTKGRIQSIHDYRDRYKKKKTVEFIQFPDFISL